MPGNLQENTEKRFGKTVNPHGTGVLRFKVLETLENSPLPLTCTDVRKMMTEAGHPISDELVRTILAEITIAGIGGRKVHSIIKRVVKTKCYAYYINKPIPKAKQDV